MSDFTYFFNKTIKKINKQFSQRSVDNFEYVLNLVNHMTIFSNVTKEINKSIRWYSDDNLDKLLDVVQNMSRFSNFINRIISHFSIDKLEHVLYMIYNMSKFNKIIKVIKQSNKFANDTTTIKNIITMNEFIINFNSVIDEINRNIKRYSDPIDTWKFIHEVCTSYHENKMNDVYAMHKDGYDYINSSSSLKQLNDTPLFVRKDLHFTVCYRNKNLIKFFIKSDDVNDWKTIFDKIIIAINELSNKYPKSLLFTNIKLIEDEEPETNNDEESEYKDEESEYNDEDSDFNYENKDEESEYKYKEPDFNDEDSETNDEESDSEYDEEMYEEDGKKYIKQTRVIEDQWLFIHACLKQANFKNLYSAYEKNYRYAYNEKYSHADNYPLSVRLDYMRNFYNQHNGDYNKWFLKRMYETMSKSKNYYDLEMISGVNEDDGYSLKILYENCRYSAKQVEILEKKLKQKLVYVDKEFIMKLDSHKLIKQFNKQIKPKIKNNISIIMKINSFIR